MHSIMPMLKQINPSYFWLTGLAIGFHFREKIPKWAQRVLSITALLSLLGGGVAMSRGIGSASLDSKPARLLASIVSPVKPAPAAPPVAPAFEILRRLRLQEAAINKKLAIEKQVQQQMMAQMVNHLDAKGLVYIERSLNNSGHNTRIHPKGPVCRVTCSVHHAVTYDVETDKQMCGVGQLAPSEDVPGWAELQGDGAYEYRNPWPAPNTPGFHSYKLYWSKK